MDFCRTVNCTITTFDNSDRRGNRGGNRDSRDGGIIWGGNLRARDDHSATEVPSGSNNHDGSIDFVQPDSGGGDYNGDLDDEDSDEESDEDE